MKDKGSDVGRKLEPNYGQISYISDCDGDDCDIKITEFEMYFDKESFEYYSHDVNVKGIECHIDHFLNGTWTNQLGDFGVDMQASDGRFVCEYTLNGQYSNFAKPFDASVAANVSAVFNPVNNNAFFSVFFEDSDVYAQIQFTGTFKNTPPRAAIGVESEIVECSNPNQSADVYLNGSQSSSGRPYGAALDHFWSDDSFGVVKVLSKEESPTIQLPLGSHDITHSVVTPRYSQNRLTTTITVEDTTPPELSAPSDITQNTCNSSQSVTIVPPVAIDACFGELDVVGMIISKNGVDLASPIELTSVNTVLEPGTYTIEWSTVDGAGNESIVLQTVTLKAGIRTTNSLTINDRAKVVLPDGGFASVLNAGPELTHIGRSAQVGGITSGGNVFVADFSEVYGDIVTSGIRDPQNVDTMIFTGTLTENANLTFDSMESDDLSGVVFPANPGNAMNINANETKTLTPGYYPVVTLNSQATLKLSAGVYYFEGLNINSDSVVIIEAAPEDIQIYLNSAFTLKESFVNGSGQQTDVFIGYVGDNTVELYAPFSGTLLAPDATVILGTSPDKTFEGRFVAGDLILTPDTVLTCNTGLTGDFVPGDSGSCTDCGTTPECSVDSDCVDGYCNAGVCMPNIGQDCSEATAVDLGSRGNWETLPANGCLKITEYPTWWNNGTVQLQPEATATSNVPFTWSNACAGNGGSGMFTAPWESQFFGPVSSICPTIINLSGIASDNIKLRWY
ncbi:MAG: hypothetical protein JXR91_17910 [Deltaproteobacteria bacterium]|nr:hypothetical protein [Deltaproteobacteria bacterium]